MKNKFEKLSSELIFSNPYWDYRKDEYISPNLEITDYHYVDSKGACMIIPVLNNNTFVLVRQYRYLNKRFSIEFPGGGLNNNLSINENAFKELEEESGYSSMNLELVGEFNPYNGVTNEICSIFIAKELVKVQSTPDKTEEFKLIYLSEKDINDRIKRNEIWDGMTLAALVPVSSFKNQKGYEIMKKISLILLLIALMFTNLVAQEDALKGKKTEDIPLYGLRMVNKSGTFFTHKIIETTNVHRIYPDETTKDYSREITYYLTSKIPGSPEDGFQTLIVTLDSMNYKFVEGESVFEYSTIDMRGKAVRFKDLECKTPPVGREFEMVYSPYGDVAAIKGQEIQETIDYVKEKGEGYLKEVDMYIWLNGLSKEHLEYLADMKKVVFPEDKISIDSIWKSPVSLEMNGYNFHDTIALKITDYNAGIYNIEGESKKISPYDKDSFTYNIQNLVKVTGVTGKGKIKIRLKATGRVELTETDYDINAKIKVGEQFIIEQIKSNVKWELINIFKL